MSVEKNRRLALLSWLFVVVLVVLCATLGAMQYRWIGEVSRAEHERLQRSLQLSLQRVSQDFDAEIGSAAAALSPESPSTDQAQREHEYAILYARWRASSAHSGLVRRLALVVHGEDSLALRNLDLDQGTFAASDWPSTWNALRDRMTARAFGDPSSRMQSFGPRTPEELALIDIPQFGRQETGGEPGPARELGWTIIELDLDYLRASLLPEILKRDLGDGQRLDYRWEIAARNDPSNVIYDSDPNPPGRASHSDASIGLFDVPYGPPNRPMMRRGPDRGGPGRGLGFGKGSARGRGPSPPPNQDRGRWLLSVQHRTGSLEALVQQARLRNLAITAGILLLMLAAVAALVQFSRRAQKLAELQMEFVAGVSHELRTPLAVIRTAAHNLGGRVISNAAQVQRYGALIEDQSEKLTDIVDRVLLFSNAKAGRPIGSREVIGVDHLLDEALGASAKIIEESRCAVETSVEPGLPPILADPTALKHALLNLIGNAAKYGGEGGWIGVFAASSVEGKSTMVEIRVADHGPGIPTVEQSYIFDAFYRGKVAVADQIHGTGLGLSLVKRIVTAHGGTVTVNSEPGKGAEFVVRIPAAPAEQIDEFADPVNRG